MKTIAIDIDDVLGNQNENIRLFVNEHYGLNLKPEDYEIEGEYWGYWEKVWGVDEAEGERRVNAYLNSKHLNKQLLLPGALEVIRRLEKKFELCIVTARHDSFIEATHEWLEAHLPKVFKGVHFVPVWGGSRSSTKAQICVEIGASYLIDDNLEHCTLAADEGIQALLFGDYGWNRRKSLPKGIIRVKDWPAVAEYFNV